jgi:hypothetical protein
MPEAERMSRVDNAWLRMDNDVNLMMIVGVWLLQPAIDYDTLCERISERLLKYPRFRQKVVQDALGASWVEDEDFDIHHQVVREKLPRKRGQSETGALQVRCGELATTPLDPQRPLWQFHLVEHHDGGSALMVRIHHCIGDGISLTSVVMSITDGGEAPPVREAADEDDDDDWLSKVLIRPFTDMAVRSRRASWAPSPSAPRSTSARRSRTARSPRSRPPSPRPTSSGWPRSCGATCATRPSAPRTAGPTTTSLPTSRARPITSA